VLGPHSPRPVGTRPGDGPIERVKERQPLFVIGDVQAGDSSIPTSR